MTRPKEARAEKQIAVFVRADLKDALAAAAVAEKRSQKALLEDALSAYLARSAPAVAAPAP